MDKTSIMSDGFLCTRAGIGLDKIRAETAVRDLKLYKLLSLSL